MGIFRRRLLYLSNDHLTAYAWAAGACVSVCSFTNDETGREEFSRHLAGSPATPTYLLADLVEEDFQRDSLPHVLGSSRRALIQRRLTQLYRDTPYRQFVQQGREAQGRKDDRMLFSALTNVALLNPWLDAMLQQKVPLAGIYSPALLSALLIKKLDLASDNLLLVTQQSSGLRQSFFKGGELKFSRLTPLIEHAADMLAETTARETANTRQFLLSTRLLPRDAVLETVVLVQRDCLPQLQSLCAETAVTTYRFIDLADAASRLGLKNPETVVLCDALFLTLLAHARSSGHYAQAAQTRFFRFRQVRLALYLLSASAVTGALLQAGSDSLEALQHFEQSQQVVLDTRIVQSQYEAIIRSLPPLTVSPENMKATVSIEQMLASNAPEPATLFAIVSRALDALPQIRIDQLQWQISTKVEAAGESVNLPQPMPGVEEQPTAAWLGIPQKPRQILLVDGEVVSLKPDYRTALESVRLFAAELGKDKRLQVEITKSPLDVAPSVKLVGKAEDEIAESKASFNLKLIFNLER